MDKMFYTLQEVCEKLGKTEDEVREMVSSGQLQEFRDKEELVFRVEQINLLAGVDEESGDVIVDLSGASGFDGSGMDLSGGVGEDAAFAARGLAGLARRGGAPEEEEREAGVALVPPSPRVVLFLDERLCPVAVPRVVTDELALGFFGYAYYEENSDRLKLVPIDDGDEANGVGAIAPSPESVRNGTYQPLSRPVYIYVNQTALERQEVSGFVDFFLTENSLIREVGYVPLTDQEYAMVRQRVEDRVTGTMYGLGNEMASLTTLLNSPSQ